MASSQHTRPETTVDKNGKITTVHKGRKPTVVVSSSRASSVTAPPTEHQQYKGVRVGQTFSMPYADSTITYTVASFRGEVVLADAAENEWGITDRPFGIEEVRRVLSWESKFERAQEITESFWRDIPVGEIVHYHNGFESFVRGRVVEDADGAKRMQPIALVGGWDRNDLPIRQSDGEVKYGYHAKSIMEGRLFSPNPSSMWEAMTEKQKSAARFEEIVELGGPGALPTIDLELPEMDDKERRTARIESLLGKVPAVVNNWQASVSERVDELRALLEEIDKES